MTIWQILIWWLISELLAWGIWWFLVDKLYINKLRTVELKLIVSTELSLYPKTQSKLLEWIRFIIWPYGVVQRTIVIHRITRKVMEEQSTDAES